MATGLKTCSQIVDFLLPLVYQHTTGSPSNPGLPRASISETSVQQYPSFPQIQVNALQARSQCLL
jgi:hypothetical protein